jgi:hypothetical protein
MRRAVLLVPVLSCLLLAACTGGGGSSDVLPTRTDSGAGAASPPTGGEAGPAARLARATAATAAAGTARTAIVATVAGLPGRREPFTLRGEGAIDFAAGRSRSILRVDSEGRAGSEPGHTEFETVAADGLVYVRAPALTSLAGASEPWVLLDPTAGADGSGAGSAAPAFGPLTGLTGSDLGAPIALLAGVDPSSVRATGAEGEGQEATTVLRATVDPVAASPEGTTPDERVALESFLQGLGASELEVEVELDGQDRLRRLVYEHDITTPSGPVHQRFDVSYFDFGAAAEVTIPPEDQVRGLANGLQGPR